MSGTILPILPPLGADTENRPFFPLLSLSTSTNPLPKPHKQWSHADIRLANQDKRLKSIIISCLPNDVMKFVIKCLTAKAMWNDLSLAHDGPPDTTDTKIEALRLKFNAFKAFAGEKVNGTFTRLKCLLNDLKNNGVSISQAEVNATFVNNLPRKWLSMNQTQRANNSIKNDTLALYGKYNYEEGLIDQIHELETSRFSIQASSSKALISNSQVQDSDYNVEKDQRSISEFLASLNVEFHERALLVNQKRFYKRAGRVGSVKKPMDKVKYKGLKAEIAILRKKIHVIPKGKSEKWLVVESFDWDEESVSFEDERITKVTAFMAIVKDESSVGKADARPKTVPFRMKSPVPGNIVHALGGRGKRKETISSKEPLPLLPKLSRAEPIGTSSDVLTLADLTQTPVVLKEIKKVTDKKTADKASKKKALIVSPSVPNPIPIKKADSPTE
ncbi:hypothetical protein Tco_0140798 [Tanacetum coccineum]